MNILFRSYNHRARLTGENREINPKSLHHSRLAIHEACSATTAAPTYFHSVRLRGRKYIDGGVWANNPAVIAWNEAVSMARSRNDGADAPKPKLLLSIGTGKQAETSRFGLFSLISFAFRSITDTGEAELRAFDLANAHKESSYFRFDVPESDGVKGLSKIRLDECKRKRTRGLFRRHHVTSTQSADGERATPSTAHFDPQTYTYKTFDKIRDRTVHYVDHMKRREIENCARLLRNTALDRRQLTPIRWQDFRRHPDPSFSGI